MHGVKFESDDEKKRLVNKRLYEHIAENVVLWNNVIIDSVSRKQETRDEYELLWKKYNYEVYKIYIQTDDETARARIWSRSYDPVSRQFSKWTIAEYEKIKTMFDPSTPDVIVIKNNGSIEELHNKLDDMIVSHNLQSY